MDSDDILWEFSCDMFLSYTRWCHHQVTAEGVCPDRLQCMLMHGAVMKTDDLK